jgi:uncharacterized membrane protein (UPF0127 family)
MNKTSMNNKKQVKKSKTNLSRILLIALAIIIALAWILFSIFNPVNKKQTGINITTSKKTGIAFEKEGNLTIYTAGNTRNINLDIEVADKEQERMKGLMDRFSLPDNAGMLFIFERDEPRSFWMKNTYISLDIIYINSNKEIVSIQKYTQPRTTSSIPSEKPAMYVLEVNAGFADKYGLKPGDKIEFSY